MKFAYWLLGDYTYTADNNISLSRYQYINVGAHAEVRLWRVERTQEQILGRMYNTKAVESGPDNVGLVAYWKFDEGQGMVAHVRYHDVTHPTWLIQFNFRIMISVCIWLSQFSILTFSELTGSDQIRKGCLLTRNQCPLHLFIRVWQLLW